MKKLLGAAALLLACASMAVGQHGAAEAGYYPMGYAGDTWTGEVTSTDDTTREITLTYLRKDKVETFTGVLEKGYKVRMKDGSYHELKPSDLHLGTRTTVYYMAKTKKVEGRKIKFYEIFRIRFLPPQKEPQER